MQVDSVVGDVSLVGDILFELTLPNKKMSKVVHRRIIILFFATMLAISSYANPDHKKKLQECITVIHYIYCNFKYIFFTSIKYHPTSKSSIIRLVAYISIYFNNHHLAALVLTGSGTQIRQQFQPLILAVPIAYILVRGTYILTNKVRKVMVYTFDRFIDETYDNFIR